jgi:hypothetical protein
MPISRFTGWKDERCNAISFWMYPKKYFLQLSSFNVSITDVNGKYISHTQSIITYIKYKQSTEC